MCCIFRNRNETACLVCQSGRSKRYVRIAHVVRVFVEPTSKKTLLSTSSYFRVLLSSHISYQTRCLVQESDVDRRQNQPYRQNNANCGLPLMPVELIASVVESEDWYPDAPPLHLGSHRALESDLFDLETNLTPFYGR